MWVFHMFLCVHTVAVCVSTGLVRETDTFIVVPGWPPLRIAGLALAAKVALHNNHFKPFPLLAEQKNNNVGMLWGKQVPEGYDV